MRRLVPLAGKGMVLMITLADVTINPKLDDSWMPDGLPDVVSQAVGTALIVLAILFVVFILAYAANKVFPSMRASWSAYGLFRVLGVMLVVVLTVGTGPTIYWVDHHVDPFPGGVTVSTSEWAATKLDTQLVKQIGVDGASALANPTHDVKNATTQWGDASEKLKKGEVAGAVGSAASSAHSWVSATQNGIRAGISAIRHRGLKNTISDGWKVLKNKAGQVGSSIAAWFKG